MSSRNLKQEEEARKVTVMPLMVMDCQPLNQCSEHLPEAKMAGESGDLRNAKCSFLRCSINLITD